MCVVFAERVSEISFRDDLDRRALALEPLAFRSLRRTFRISTGLNASRRRPRSQPSSNPPRRRDLRRFDSFYHALLISQRELARQDERFAARFHRFARLAKDRSDVGLRRVLVEKRSLVAGTKAR